MKATISRDDNSEAGVSDGRRPVMIRDLAPYGALALRLGLGTMWIAHALLKWFVFTIPGFGAWLADQGLPAMAAWPVFLLELVGGLAILVGFHGRLASAVLLPVMLVAMLTHVPNGWLHTSSGGGWEYPAFLAMASLAHVLVGDGALALHRFASAGPRWMATDPAR